MYIVLWTTKNKTGNTKDHWDAFEDLEEAKERYSFIVESVYNLYTASLAGTLESTDYDQNVEPIITGE